MSGFLDRPQTVPLRRAIFTVHLWAGIAVGLYLFVICLTGASLVFRIDMQRAMYPELLTPQSAGPMVGAEVVLDAVQNAYKDSRVAGVEAPTTTRPVYLAYVAEAAAFHAVLIDPASARILGEVPEQSPIKTLQELHFNLLMGKTGKLVNGLGALCLLLLCLTGVVIWWQGRSRWHRGLVVRWKSGWAQMNWDLHSALGIWTLVILLIWGLTALNFTFPRQFRAVVQSFTTISTINAPGSTPPETVSTDSKPTSKALIQRAQTEMPGQFVARVILPASERDAFKVMFAGQQPTPAGARNFGTVYLDQYTGDVLTAEPVSGKTAGDYIMEWASPLHVGNFGGTGVKILWLLLGLAPPLLFATGTINWWRRVVRPAYVRTMAAGGHRGSEVVNAGQSVE